MSYIFVSKSAALADWASDVGLSKHVFKIGLSDSEPKKNTSQNWCGLTDWVLLKTAEAKAIDEAEMLARLVEKVKLIDPMLYPKIKAEPGITKVTPQQVENFDVLSRALTGDAAPPPAKLKPADFAAYLIAVANR